jgi:pSer/pThr/pTyr-binding forkhead associated (FHA) protein
MSTDSIILGRGDVTMTPETYIDLTAYGAIDKGGVSRRHAVLQRVKRTITICDLDSRNGTYLNDARLIPHQARFL